MIVRKHTGDRNGRYTSWRSRSEKQGAWRCVPEGGTTKDRFLEYLRENMLPCLKEGDIVIMDNLRARHTQGVEELLRSVGTVPIYLPSCINLIEKMWSKR